MKKLHQFEDRYNDFYVPAFVVEVSGRDLVQDLLLTVTSIQVDLKHNAAGRFSFTVAGAFDWERREFLGKTARQRVDLLELFAFGAEVEVWIGYDEPARLQPIIKGIVTELGTSFAESGNPALTVSGYDALYSLGIGRATRRWDNRKPSDAVRDVAGQSSLPVSITARDAPERRIDQDRESDRAFIAKMADLARSIFYVRGGRLHFGPRRNDAAAVAELAWGEGLSSFSPRANIAKQIAGVEVHGWSAAQGKAIVGRARRGEERGIEGSTQSGSQRLARALSTSPILSVSAPVHTQQEADDRARAILEERAQDFLTGDGECVGLPDLVPDTNVKVSGVGRAFSKTYYITETTHSLDGRGYRTRFSVEEPSI